MSANSNDKIQGFYDGRHVFCTGATGMLGTAYLVRLILDTSVSRIYALVRGGESRFWKLWRSRLPGDMIRKIISTEKLVIWNGDITHHKYGLREKELKTVFDNVSIFVHGASTINLKRPLAEVAPEIVYPSLAAAAMSVCCEKLTKFIYISTAYSSAFITQSDDGTPSEFETYVHENIRSLAPTSVNSLLVEISSLAAAGTTSEFESANYPFAYSYAKHLTERLLTQYFDEAGQSEKLMIFRPSCIGPAERHPFPFYEVPGSCPGTNALASLIISPSTEWRASSPLLDPSSATLDEVPVDIVVNRLIIHVAFGSTGCVHAVAGVKGSYPSETLFAEAITHRRYWWGQPRLSWIKEDWKSENQAAAAKMFAVFGCSFDFEERKTDLVWEKLSACQQLEWPLWYHRKDTAKEWLAGRKEAVTAVIGFLLRSRGLPASFAHLFYKPINKNSHL